MKYVIYFIFITSEILFSQQSGWQWQNPLPQGNSLNTVFFIDATTGWAAGGAKTIIKTKDGGYTWEIQNSSNHGIIYDIFFWDNNNGIYFDQTEIFKTVNGGENWIYNSSAPVVAHDIFFIDNNIGWIVGEGGAIAKTTDSGNSWIVQFVDTTIVLRKVHFINQQIGWAVGFNWDGTGIGIILKTQNGGENWEYVNLTISYPLNEVYFLNSNIGFIVGDSDIILYTTDQGINWNKYNTSTYKSYNNIFFINPQIGWITGGNILKTTDGGNSWNSISNQSGGNDSYFVNENLGFIVGGNGAILKTYDSGVTWQTLNTSIINRNLLNIQFLNNQIGYIICDRNIILKTENGGATWDKYPINNDVLQKLTSMYFINEDIGWTVETKTEHNALSGNRIYKTNNGGSDWELSADGLTESISDIQFIDYSNGWVVGDSGLIMKSIDGGYTWIEQISNTKSKLQRICMITPNIGYVCGLDGVILKTINGGDSWDLLNSVVKLDYYTNLFFLSENNGWFVGRWTDLIRTKDGGQSWEEIRTDIFTTYQITTVYFLNENIGYFTCPQGIIGNTIDGGETWQVQMSGTFNDLNDICFLNNNIGFIVGSNGTILKTNSNGEFKNKISGFIKLGSYPLENNNVKLYTFEVNKWQINNSYITWQDGYYEFSGLEENIYLVIPDISYYGFNFYGYHVFNEDWNDSYNCINLENYNSIRRNFNLIYNLKLIQPYNIRVSYPLQIEWQSDLSYLTNYYSITLSKRNKLQTGSSHYSDVYSTSTPNNTITIDDLNESGYFKVVVSAYDENSIQVGYLDCNFYAASNSRIYSGSITENSTWEDMIIIKGDLTIEENVVVNIKPGTIVFFDTLDTYSNPGNFSINVRGQLNAEGESGNLIEFTSYPNDGINWNSIIFNNNYNENSISYINFIHSKLPVCIINSNLSITNCSFTDCLQAISVDSSKTRFERCFFNNSHADTDFIIIKNNSTPSFNNCNFINVSNILSPYFIKLYNNLNDIYVKNSYWLIPLFIDNQIFDKNDDPSLGRVIYDPVLSNPVNISKGAESVTLRNMNSLLKTYNSSESDVFNVIGEPDNNLYFLNSKESIILDFGEDGDIFNNDSIDIIVFAKNYSTVPKEIIIELSLSNDLLYFGETIGFINNESAFDISQLDNYHYRYARISNYSERPSNSDSVGIYIDAIISLHDSASLSYILPDKISNILKLHIEQNYPNPFNSYTKIKYFLPTTENVKLEVFNILGQNIGILVNEIKQPGYYEVTFNGNNYASGIYILRIQAGEFKQVRKMILLR